MNKEKWEEYIKRIKQEIKKEYKEEKGIEKKNKERLKKEIINAVRDLIPKEKFKEFAVMFSGGVDSSLIALIAKRFSKDFWCYCVYFYDKNIKDKDIIYAEKVAKALSLKLRKIKLSLDDIEKMIKPVVKLVGKDIVKVGVALVDYAVMQEAKKQNIRYVFSGLGSEEIFAGYERHLVKDVNKECWNGLMNMYNRDIIRDKAVARYFRIKLLFPFLEKEVIKEAMKISGKEKIKKIKGRVFKKYILREIACELGLAKEFAFRKKLAAQYGSNMIKAIKKLAKKNGFRYMKDYINSL